MSFADAAPEIHLEEAILRGHESLREEEIVLGFRVNVWYAPGIAANFDSAIEARDAELAVDLGEPFSGESLELCARSLRLHDAPGQEHCADEQPQRG